MNRILIALACSCASPPPDTAIHPRACGDPCSTSIQCGNFSGCRFCSTNGKCSSTLPATPEPIDAGVDALGGLSAPSPITPTRTP